MNRTRGGRALRALVPTALLLLAPGGARAVPLLSEVFYDATGSDDGLVFVELWAPPGTSVEGLALQGVNGANGDTTVTIDLVGSVPEDGFLVVADAGDGGVTQVANADLVVDFDFQNGPDSIVLVDGEGTVLDAVGYGVFEAGDVFAGEGSPAPDPPAGASLARAFADVDTDDNAADWLALETPTPGEAPLETVPEPSAVLLLLTGLLVLGVAGHRRVVR